MIKYFNLATVAQQVQNQYDEDGKISEEVLPSYVDDVEEYAVISDFPEYGESGKIYIDSKTNALYRWSESDKEYVPISDASSHNKHIKVRMTKKGDDIAYTFVTDIDDLSESFNNPCIIDIILSEGKEHNETILEKFYNVKPVIDNLAINGLAYQVVYNNSVYTIKWVFDGVDYELGISVDNYAKVFIDNSLQDSDMLECLSNLVALDNSTNDAISILREFFPYDWNLIKTENSIVRHFPLDSFEFTENKIEKYIQASFYFAEDTLNLYMQYNDSDEEWEYSLTDPGK